MDKLNVTLLDTSYSPNLIASYHSLSLLYPCSDSAVCSPYVFSLPKGIFRFEAYGASGGSLDGQVSTLRSEDRTTCTPQKEVERYRGNTYCTSSEFSPGSGGYISGVLTLEREVQFYAFVGGAGRYGNFTLAGGFNGGGNATGDPWPAASGGGATDVRVSGNGYRHRIIVAGGGGGTDDNQGSGGCGGYPVAQSYWAIGKYKNISASQTSGFSFGQGQSGSGFGDIGGAGGGWYGGYASFDGSAGAGGGSSFILTHKAQLPSLDDYPLGNESEFFFREVAFSNGIWKGNGMIRITHIPYSHQNKLQRNIHIHLFALIPAFLQIK